MSSDAVVHTYALSRLFARTVECNKRTEELHELLDEVKAGEVRERVAGSALVLLQALLISAEDEVLELRKQLAECQAKRTVGGTHRGYTPDWSPNPSAKFSGERPPPYAPPAGCSGSALGTPELNRFSEDKS